MAETRGLPESRMMTIARKPLSTSGVVVFAAAAGGSKQDYSYDDDSIDEHPSAIDDDDDDDYVPLDASAGEQKEEETEEEEVDAEREKPKLKKKFIDEQGNIVQLRDESDLNPSFVLMGDIINTAIGKLSGGSDGDGDGSGGKRERERKRKGKGGVPFVRTPKPKRVRQVGETALFVRKQDSSIFGIVEGLGLQYKMGIYKQVDDELLDDDPGLNQLLVSPGSSISQLWTQDKWERHRGVSRYWRHLGSTHRSTVFTRVLEPVIIITFWAAFWTLWNSTLVPAIVAAGKAALEASAAAAAAAVAGAAGAAGASSLHPLTGLTMFAAQWAAGVMPAATSSVAHSLAGLALGLVLVFRTNSSFARLVEARVLLGNLVRCVRDLARLAQYIPESAKVQRAEVVGYAAAVGYACDAHVRKGRTRANPEDPTAFRVDASSDIARILGEKRAEEYNRAGNKPMYLAAAVSKSLKQGLEAGMSEFMHSECEATVTELHKVIGGCERIQSTPIPVSYTRHTSRSLMLWLLTLPFALWPAMKLATVPAVFLVTYLMLGIDEIGVQIEEPFAVLPVKPLAEVCERDVRELDKQLELGAFDDDEEGEEEEGEDEGVEGANPGDSVDA